MEAAALPRTVDDIYKDYKARRAGLIKALTIDVEEFYQQCDPDKENLCLYGHSDETWEVNLPAEEVPPELPEPALGINFPRDGLDRRDWLSLVAVHSDVWLLAVSSFYAARFDRNDRKRLFNMINELPTIREVVSGKKKSSSSTKEKTSVSNGNKSKSTPKSSSKPAKPSAPPPPKEEDEPDEEDEEEHGDTFCGACDGPYTNNEEFWIGCDICEKWYHGKCVKITPAKAEHIEQYKCPSCIGNKRART